jgi:hypothetical protein
MLGNCSPQPPLVKIIKHHFVNISVTAIEPASCRLRVKIKLSTNVSKLPAILQLSALATEREWESRVRINIGAPLDHVISADLA